MNRTDRITTRMYDWVKLLLAAIVTLGVTTTSLALAAATPASATATPVLQSTIAAYNLTAVAPSGSSGSSTSSLTAAVANPSTATALSFTSIGSSSSAANSFTFAQTGTVDVTSAACGLDIFSYTANPFTVSGTGLGSGGTGITGTQLVYAQNSPTCAIPSGSTVFQEGTPTQTYAQKLVASGASSVNPSSLTITSQPPITDGYAIVNATTGVVSMQPETTATGNFSATYAYCIPGVILSAVAGDTTDTVDPSGLSDGNCSTGVITYTAVTKTALVGQEISLLGGLVKTDIYQAVASAVQVPATVAPGQTFTYTQAPKTSLLPVLQSSSAGASSLTYAAGFASIQPIPAGLTYVPGSIQTIGGDPNTFGQATARYCTAATTGCDAQINTGNYKTTYPYIEEELNGAVHISGGGTVTLPTIQMQLKVTGTPGTTLGSTLPEFKTTTVADAPLVGSTSVSLDAYPTSCASYTTSGNTGSCTGAPPYTAPTPVQFSTITAGVTGVTTPGGSATGNDGGGSTVQITGSGFTGASAVNFGATPASSFTVNSSTSITAVAPAGADGTVDVTVVNASTTSGTSSSDHFTYVPASQPDVPTGISVTPGDGTPADGAATVAWTATYGEGSPVTGYSVSATDNTTPANPVQTCSSTDPADSCSLSGLTNGDSYTFAVTATNALGTSAAGTVTVNEGAPSAPTGVSASAGQESASVSFSPPATSGDGSTVSGYQVTAVDTTTPANGGQTATGSSSPVSVGGLTDGDAYTFTVTATNSSGTSQPSNPSTAVTPIGAPGAPVGVSATGAVSTSSVVSWSPPASNGGSSITSYKVTATDGTTPANGGQTCTFTIPSPAPDYPYSCTVSSLTNGDSYTFTVTATNAIGTGSASAASAAVVPSTVPGAPTSVTAHANPDGTVQVTWVAPASNGGAAVSGYTATSSSTSKTCSTPDGTTLTCAISGNTIGTSYTYTVKATNVSGSSAASTASASTPTTSVPAAPTAPVGTGGTGQVSVAFTGDTTTAQTGGLTITGYTATATDVTNPANGGQTGTATTSPVVVTGLTTGDVYTFTVHATNSAGNSPESVTSPQVTPGSPPSAPQNVTATNVSPGGNAQISWNPPASPNGTITQYTVTSSTGSKTCTYTGPFGPGETDTCTVTGLTIGTSYTYTAVAINGSGTSATSAASNAVVSSTIPNAPTALSATTGNASATVSFTGDTTTATTGGSAITGYTVTATDATNALNGGQTASALASPITVSGLTNGDTYTFTVHATNANGNGAESTATSGLNPGRPGAPSAVVAGADASSTTTLDVSWAAAVSPDGTSPITGYTVTSSPGSFTCTTTGATTCNVSGLTAKTAYTFTVTATNQFGTSPASAASASMSAGFPGVPTNVLVSQAVAGGNGTVTVTWTVPNNGGAALTTETATSSTGSKTCTDTTHLTAGATATCNLTALTVGTSYTVTVKATNANGTGTASAASAAIVPATTPSAPTAVTAATGNGQETVSYTAGSAQGGTISGYTVTSSPGGITCTSTTTTCVVTGLTNGTSYTFTVTETTQYATSVASAASTALAAGAPNPPTGVVSAADASSATTLDVSWAAATSPDGSSPITGYTVTSSPGSLTCTTTGATSCNVTGLTAKTAYTFTVKATNQYGSSVASAASTSISAGFPGIPSGFSAVLTPNTANGTTGSATVTWTTPNNGGSALTSQTATSSSGSKTCTDNTHTTSGATSSCTVTGLTVGTAYTFTIKDVNANGTGPASGATNSVTIETLPLAPTAVSAAAGNQQATVSFTAPATTNSGAISGYTVTATDTTTSGNGGQTASGSSSPIVVTGLTNGDNYTFTVRATAVDGTGAASAATAGLIPSTLPDAPTGVTGSGGNSSVTASWTASNNEGSPITGYTATAIGDGSNETCTTSSTSCTITGLTNGVSYTVQVTATNANGTSAASAASAAVVPSTVPDAPTGASATAGDSSVTVSWTASDSGGGLPITGYTVSDGSGDTCTTPDGTTTTCTVTGLTNGTGYSFTVTATNADGSSAASSATASVTPATVPDAPTGVVATPGNHVASVSWTAPFNEGSPITGYTVSDGAGHTCSTPDGTTTTCTVTGLTNGQSYAFTVSASNALGTGSASTSSNPVVPLTVPDAPTGVSAVAGNQSATVSWTAANAEGSTVTSYTVSDGTGDTCTTPDGTSTSCTVSGLTNGTAYTFTVTANSSQGSSVASSASNGVTPNTVPDAPTGVSAVAGNQSATVSWTASNAEGSTVTSYTVSDGTGDTCTTPDGTSTSCTVSGLTNGTAYTFTVTASNADGTSAASSASSSVTPVSVPDAPTGVSATAGDSSASVSWTAGADEGSPITGYTVTSSPGGLTCSSSSTSCAVSGLSNGTAYTFTVTATNATGTSDASAASSAVTPSTVPDAPTGVSASPSDRSAMVSWSAPSDEGSSITSYLVTTSPGGQTCTTSGTSCAVSGLSNGTAYTFTVTATNADGTGSASAASTPVTPSTVPGAPTGVSAVAANGSATISWTAPFNEGTPITNYSVLSSTGKSCSSATTSCSISGLTNGVAVTFTVTATNANGTGPASAPSAPVTPTSNTSSFTSASSVTIGAGKNLNFSVTTVGTPKPTVSASGVPAWMVFKAGVNGKLGTAKLTGKGPAVGGAFTVTLHANNGTGPDNLQVFTVHVLAISSSPAASFTKGVFSSVTITTAGGASGVAITGKLSPKLAGLTLHDNGDGTATISGTPAAKDKSATVSLKATSGTASATQKLAIGIS